MDLVRPLTVVAVFSVAVVAGGAAVRLTALATDAASVVTLALVAVLLVAVVVSTARRRRPDTPYW